VPPFITALIILVGGYWLIKKSAASPKAKMPALSQKMVGGAIMAFAAVLMLRGDINASIGLFVFGMGLYGKSAMFPNGFNPNQNTSTPPPEKPRSTMSPHEALQVLGLKLGATADEVKQAHKRLIKDFHPDKGGSDYLAAKINEAKDILLR
jgi:DnaJ domain